jgi:hypothetical protein
MSGRTIDADYAYQTNYIWGNWLLERLRRVEYQRCPGVSVYTGKRLRKPRPKVRKAIGDAT